MNMKPKQELKGERISRNFKNIILTSRSSLEKQLQISELKFRRLFETAQDGILLLDAITGVITDVNPFILKLIGYTHAEIIGKKLWEISPFRDIKANKDAFKELQKKEIYSL